MDNYVRPSVAAAMLGVSQRTLARWVQAGYATPGVHFVQGPFRNSPRRWKLEALPTLTAPTSPAL